MWLIYDPATETIVEKGFENNVKADEWVVKQIEDGVEDARNWIICPDSPGFNED
jgi:hypothetical protein